MQMQKPNFKINITVRPKSKRPYWLYVDAGNTAHDRWQIDYAIMHIRLDLRHESFKFDYNRVWSNGRRFLEPAKEVRAHLFKFDKEEDRMITIMTNFGGL
jgi:hypothetical protein